ncbi:uncharacterized protein KIAA1958-like [Ptychodera flava]|uniref:uncharacterized protein KIAA1958-like n=1 Tax=Ptychodera flava TaxID=63121 RepID=UPI00396A952E
MEPVIMLNINNFERVERPDSSGENLIEFDFEGREGEKRFRTRTEDEIIEIEENRNEQTTKRATKWGVNQFKCWLREKGFAENFEILPVDDLNNKLREFYASLCTRSGEDYAKSSLVGIRAAINRHLTSVPYNRPINILRDREFNSSNHVFVGLIKKLKREGKDTSTHKSAIQRGDLAKLMESGVLSMDTPQALLRKVWFDIMVHFCRRGREGLRDMTKSSLVFEHDDIGAEFVRMAYNEKNKIHQGTLNPRDDVAEEKRMYAQPGSAKCPVRALKLYLSKLHPKQTAMFQRPLTFIDHSAPIWYYNAPLGSKKLGDMMKDISKAANLSMVYTNHCLRATAATILAGQNVSTHLIMKVTGHRNEESVKHYVTGATADQRRSLSGTLFSATTGEKSSLPSARSSFSEKSPSTDVLIPERTQTTPRATGNQVDGIPALFQYCTVNVNTIQVENNSSASKM